MPESAEVAMKRYLDSILDRAGDSVAGLILNVMMRSDDKIS